MERILSSKERLIREREGIQAKLHRVTGRSCTIQKGWNQGKRISFRNHFIRVGEGGSVCGLKYGGARRSVCPVRRGKLVKTEKELLKGSVNDQSR